VNEMVEITGLRKRQVYRALQFYLEKKFIMAKKDKYSGFRRKGKIAYYTLSYEIYNKLG